MSDFITIQGKRKVIDKDWLYQRYLVENKSWKEIAQLAQCSEFLVAKHIKEYGFEKSLNQIVKAREKTFLKRFGVKNPSQDEEIKKKRINTNLKKYGVKNQFQRQDIKERIIRDNLDKYGVENVSKLKSIKEKKIKTLFKNHGVTSPIRSPSIKKKNQTTVRERYGVNYIPQSKVIIERVKSTKFSNGDIILICGKSIPEWSNYYNVPESALYSFFKKENNPPTDDKFFEFCESYERSISNIENILSQNLNIPLFDKKAISGNYRPDFKLNEKVFLNADGLYWHSELHREKNYHFNLRKEFEDNNLRILQFREHEIIHQTDIVLSIINNAIGKTSRKIGARKTQIVQPNNNEAKLFLNKNHIKGYKPSKYIGLTYNDELVSLMTYKIIKKRVKIERFCSKINTSVIGGFSKLLKNIESTYNFPIDYWVDLRYGTGTFLLNHGFSFEKETLGWEWTDFNTTYNRLKCRANMDERGLSEKEHAEELGWVKIYDAGQRLYTKEKS